MHSLIKDTLSYLNLRIFISHTRKATKTHRTQEEQTIYGIYKTLPREIGIPHTNYLPNLARRFTQLGTGTPTRRMQTSLQKWLQFLCIKLYDSPVYSHANSSMKSWSVRTSIQIVPTIIDLRNWKPGYCLGFTSKTPLVG